jgi:hypothetical protein
LAAGAGAAVVAVVDVGLLVAAPVVSVVPDDPDEPHAARSDAAPITAANERNLPQDMTPMMPRGLLELGLRAGAASVKIL